MAVSRSGPEKVKNKLEKGLVENVEKIPTFTNGDYEAKVFQAIINGDINDSNYV